MIKPMVLSSNILDMRELSQQILYECWTKGLDEVTFKDMFSFYKGVLESYTF